MLKGNEHKAVPLAQHHSIKAYSESVR